MVAPSLGGLRRQIEAALMADTVRHVDLH